MAQFQRRFVQELTKPLIVRQCGDLGFSGDNLSDVISVDLYTDGEAYSGGGTCAGACICPDGSAVALSGSVSGKTASVTLTEDCFAIPGQIGIAIRVTSGTTKTTVLKAIYNVEQFSTNNPVDPGSRITLDVDTLINRIDAATADIPASDMASLMAGIAPTFSATTAYSAGAYVYYNGTLYRFTADHAAGSWTGTDSTAVALGTDVADLKESISEDKVAEFIHDYCRLRIWNDSTGFKAYNARLSCVLPINCPFDVYIDANDVTNKMGMCRLLFFSANWANPSVFLRYEDYTIGVNGRNIVKIPANSYCCFQLSQSDNSNFSSQSLGENIKVSFSPQIDANLNTSGAAADAKATGEALQAIDDSVGQLETDTETAIETSKNNVLSLISNTIATEISNVSGGEYSPQNAISSTLIQYRFLDTVDGIKEISSSYSDWYVANEIVVQPFTFYFVNGSAQYNEHAVYQVLDSDGNIIAQEYATSSTVLTLENKLIYTPYNATSIRVASVTGSSGASVYSAQYIGSKIWAGKKWVCIGDSLTEANIRTTMHYHDYIAEKTGITVVNLGAGGTGYKRSYAGIGPFIDRVDQIPTDADVVTIFGSGNDAIYTIGDPSDTGTDSLCSAINATIAAIFNRITTCQLGIVTPCPWETYNPANNDNWMARYSAAIVQICKNWGVPCLDLYHCSNLRPWDATFRAAAYSKDSGNGVHPDETGHKLIAPRFEALLDSLLLH